MVLRAENSFRNDEAFKQAATYSVLNFSGTLLEISKAPHDGS